MFQILHRIQTPASLPQWVPTGVLQRVPVIGLTTAILRDNLNYNKNILREEFK